MQEGKKPSLVKQRDFYVSLVILAAALFVKYGTSQITAAESRVLPNILIFIMALCGIILLIQTVMNRSGQEDSKSLTFSTRELLGGLCMILCWVLIPILGFYTAISLMIVLFGLIMESGACLKPKQYIRIIAVGIVTAAILYFCFAKMLHIITPVGLWI